MDITKGINSMAKDLKEIGLTEYVNEGEVIVDDKFAKFLLNRPARLDCRNLIYPPTPAEYLDGKIYHETTPKEITDYGKAIAIYSSDNPLQLQEIYSPSASIGICQLGNGKFVLIFKDKPKVKGFCLPGGTLGRITSNPRELSQLSRSTNYSMTLTREFLEETGIQISEARLLSVESPSARLNHFCAVYLCKGNKIQEQREEDSDHYVLEVSYDELIAGLTSELAIDSFIIPLLTSQSSFIKSYFETK